ncbi:MAG: GPW/gp25 family protein [Paludibacteraceae bacterium]|nr:GPW/gp25 family protein [Paludibacteraceae bacterium]
MTTLSIPLAIQKGRFVRTDALADSITANLTLLVNTERLITAPDPHFGFVFNNLKFENVNEKEGVVYHSTTKLSGSSKSLNTFAAELQSTITRYEPRLRNVKVNMTYVREEKQIYTIVDAVISDTKEPYQFSTTIKVWH